MKTWLFGGIALACLLGAGAAAACPKTGEGSRPIRPVVQDVSAQARALMERAARLDGDARTREAEARTLEREAETFAVRARRLRIEAARVAGFERTQLLESANELALRAAEDRAAAAEDRAGADRLRVEAQTLRDRAVALLENGGGGGGWRRVRAPDPPRPVERGFVL